MRDRLSRGLSDVHADVEAVGVMFREDRLAGDRQGGGELHVLFARGVEPASDVAGRDEEGVAFADGVGVPDAEDIGASVEDTRGIEIAEGAGLFGHSARWWISSVPSRPAATHSAQRQRRMQRLAVQDRWQTGQRWV